MPKISVIMPAYNAEKYIGEAIESILNQTYTDFEFIIIDDGSTDGTANIVKSYGDSRIRFYQNEQNMGVAATLNRGLDLAVGEYIARMDSDDISLPERFEKQVAYMNRHSEIGVVGVATIEFGEEIEKEEKCYCVSDPVEAKASLFFSTCLAHPTVMIRHSILQKHGLRYDSAFEGTEDYYFWWNIAHFADVCVIDEALFKYRIHKNQVTQNFKPTVLDRIRRFAEIRLKEFEIAPTARECDLFYRSTIGQYKGFNEADLSAFIGLFAKVSLANREKALYPDRNLDSNLGSVLLRAISGCNLNDNEKKKFRRLAVKTGLISMKSQIKMLCKGELI